MKSKEENLLNEQGETKLLDSSCWQFMRATIENLSQQQIDQVQLQKLSPAALAYLGDAVYELYVRMYYLLPPQRSESYHRLVVAQVRAETQALHLRSLTPHLRHSELEIVRRGRNATTGRPKRLDPEIYQQASSLETLIGYLYLTDQPRLAELLQRLQLEK
ncbi:Mini-ribonuclease 3 [Fischerella thermalis]|uniref:Mini-ribonuclease 3 n=1 Tax=Fischerella thermalis TaxID=372787 RepID=UPI0019F18331|nr:ribonuclease III domain-containing protein [Fischerella thermalis]MBF1988287.1 ribonuclease III [Fischerella thermalis M58_A2018_009]MBF2061687.1 ribonuclease III [Fischerella thermalis M66_A2018_004]